MDDFITAADRAYEKHMRGASETLAQCIERAKAGLPTEAPEGLASIDGIIRPPRAYAEAELNAIRDMRARGRTVGQIAMALKRTEGSIKSAIRSHGEVRG